LQEGSCLVCQQDAAYRVSLQTDRQRALATSRSHIAYPAAATVITAPRIAPVNVNDFFIE
jgi:hypothetical protein